MASSRRRAILGGALLAASIALARPAAAQEVTAWEAPPATAADTARMRQAMHVYFEGEKREAWAFGAGGVLTASGGTALGIGAGVALQSAAMLTFDFHASARADAYAAAIGAFAR